MHRFYKQLSIFAVLFSLLLCISVYAEWSYGPQVILPVFFNETHRRDHSSNKVHSDFSYDDRRSDFGNHELSARANNFEKYTAQDFQHHFGEYGYTETEILHQRCLYMHDEFVKYAQIYSGYKDTIQKLHAELKNLNVIQKAWCIAKGTYCRKLQKRIAFLHRQLSTAKTISQDNNFYEAQVSDKLYSSTKVANFDRDFFDEQFAEYKVLEAIYNVYVPSLAKAINARSNIYRDIAANDSPLACVRKSYTLNDNAKGFLSRYGHELVPFTYCYGNQLQQAIHQESLDILDRIDTLTHDSILYDHQEALVDFAAAMVDYNHAGLTDKAMTIGDLCWTLLDYGQAIVEGAALGVYSAAHDILTNPIEATVCFVAGKQVLAYQLCKVLYNVADIGVTAIHNVEDAKEKWNKYAEPLNNIIHAINKKEITVRDAIKGGTAFVVGYKAQGKLLGGLGKFCNAIKHKSISFVKNNSLLNPQEYLTTPEGLLFKATGKSDKLKSYGKANSPSHLKKVVDDKVLQATTLPAASIVEKGIIRNDLRSVIQRYKEHIFSKKHVKNGLMSAGESQEEIMDLLNDVIISLDKKGLLKEGANQIKATINGVKNVEIKCFIENGSARSVDAYISDFNRLYNNFIDTTKA